jgi:hypothetical protein
MTKDERGILQTKDFLIEDAKRNQELARLKVVERELYARSNKAEYDTMYYFLKAHEIQDEYVKKVMENREKEEAQREVPQEELIEEFN